MMMSSDDCNKSFQSVHVISQDSYFYISLIPDSERKNNSFENEHGGMDWDRIVQNVRDVVITINSKENGRRHTARGT